MDIPTKTSQSEFSGVDGQNISAPAKQWADEPQGAPGPVTEPVKGDISKIDSSATSQQKSGEYSDPGGK